MLFSQRNSPIQNMMTDIYLQNMLKKYRPVADLVVFMTVWSEVNTLAQSWAGNYLNECTASGSYSKGTAIKGGTDFDFFLSIKTECSNSLQEIYENLFIFLSNKNLNPRKQNVSVGMNLNGQKIDLVPGKKQPSIFSNDHSLYKFKQKTWTKTNVKIHIDHVRSSGRIDEIKLLKIWRYCQKIDAQSFYLELLVLEAFSNPFDFLITDLHSNFLKILDFISSEIQTRTIQDPSNSANLLSDDLSIQEKKTIAQKASISAAKIRSGKISEVIW
ncbi:MAG: hypothetical protein ACD_35C00094G0008 [uncultured bacterium]|nr:MAG: hypothetical protein ACD_35C00094G0008 [uncultured bacterium]